MSISEELASAYRSLQERFFASPGQAWAPWVRVSDATGQSMITLLNTLIEQAFHAKPENSIVIGDHEAYHKLAAIARMCPWNEILFFDDSRNSVRLVQDFSKCDCELLFRIFIENSFAVE